MQWACFALTWAWLALLTGWLFSHVTATARAVTIALVELKEKLRDHNGVLAEMRRDREDVIPKAELMTRFRDLDNRIIRLDNLASASKGGTEADEVSRARLQWAIGTLIVIGALVVNHYWTRVPTP